ncbi:MAG: M24 family metallopeptidase [Microthrixaceae bacterium]
MYEIGRAIEASVAPYGYGVVREFIGHGIGDQFHTSLQIPHYYDPRNDTVLLPGMTFTVEPMINVGSNRLDMWDDGWTVVHQGPAAIGPVRAHRARHRRRLRTSHGSGRRRAGRRPLRRSSVRVRHADGTYIGEGLSDSRTSARPSRRSGTCGRRTARAHRSDTRHRRAGGRPSGTHQRRPLCAHGRKPHQTHPRPTGRRCHGRAPGKRRRISAAAESAAATCSGTGGRVCRIRGGRPTALRC